MNKNCLILWIVLPSRIVLRLAIFHGFMEVMKSLAFPNIFFILRLILYIRRDSSNQLSYQKLCYLHSLESIKGFPKNISMIYNVFPCIGGWSYLFARNCDDYFKYFGLTNYTHVVSGSVKIFHHCFVN